MGLFDLFRSNNDDLLELQKLVVENAPDKLIMSGKQLKVMANQRAANSLRIAQDCCQILQTTTSPDVFFDRFHLFAWHCSELALLEKYVSFSGASPTEAFSVLMSEKQECIRQFLVRYFGKVFDKAESLKTEKGKLNQYQKFYDSLKPYFSEMDADNIDYIETKHRAYTRLLTK